VVDLGCGEGTATASLLARWPGARVTGVDSSPEMLAAAAQVAVPGRVEFVLGDVRTWEPEGPVDVVVSNAVLHWVTDHAQLMARWAGRLAAGGWLAVEIAPLLARAVLEAVGRAQGQRLRSRRTQLMEQWVLDGPGQTAPTSEG